MKQLRLVELESAMGAAKGKGNCSPAARCLVLSARLQKAGPVSEAGQSSLSMSGLIVQSAMG